MDIVLDTDIGTNVDDVLALLVLAGAPGLTLRAVTTVDGDTRLRARHARVALDHLSLASTPVHAGHPTPSSRPIWPVPDGPRRKVVDWAHEDGLAAIHSGAVATDQDAGQELGHGRSAR